MVSPSQPKKLAAKTKNRQIIEVKGFLVREGLCLPAYGGLLFESLENVHIEPPVKKFFGFMFLQ